MAETFCDWCLRFQNLSSRDGIGRGMSTLVARNVMKTSTVQDCNDIPGVNKSSTVERIATFLDSITQILLVLPYSKTLALLANQHQRLHESLMLSFRLMGDGDRSVGSFSDGNWGTSTRSPERSAKCCGQQGGAFRLGVAFTKTIYWTSVQDYAQRWKSNCLWLFASLC